MNPPCRTFCLALAAVAVLNGCGGEEPPAPAADTRPVKTFIVEGGQSGGQRSFPGRIESATRAELSFRVRGTVQDILVKEGDLVEPDQVLARLDPTDYETVVRDRQATFDNSQRNFERARELIEKGFISGTEFDRLEANFKTSEASLEAARQDLAYTELKAPFGGRVAKRHVERFEEVDIKQTVFTLQDVATLQVKIDLPESLVRGLREKAEGEAAVPAFATFDGQAGAPLPLTVAEVSTRADPQTQTFEVTFNMPQPQDFVVLPGMTANVTADLSSRLVQAETSHWLPVSAVVADSALGSRVWVLDPQTMTVRAVAVAAGRMQGDRIEILSGLAGGEEIVSVGASYLAEGMRVSRMTTGEQAVPRVEDPAGDLQ